MPTLKNVQFVKDGIRQAVEMKERLVPLVNSPRLRGLWPQPTVRLDPQGNIEPDVASVIQAVGVELASLGTEAEPSALEKPKPVVPVRRSVRPDHLVCLICGRKQKLLKRHLSVEHELTPNQYREIFGLKSDYPMAAPNYTEQRRQLALSIGLGRPKKPARRRRKPTARAAAAKN